MAIQDQNSMVVRADDTVLRRPLHPPPHPSFLNDLTACRCSSKCQVFFFLSLLQKKIYLAAGSSVPHMRFVRASAGMWPWPPLADLWPLKTIHHIRHTVWQRPSPASQPAGHKVSADRPLKDRFIFSAHFRRCPSVCRLFFFLRRDSGGPTGSRFGEMGGEWRSRSFRGNSGGEVNFLLICFQGKKKGHYPKWGFGLPRLAFKLVIRNIPLFRWHLWCFWMVFPGGHLCIRMNFKLMFFCYSMLIKMELREKAPPPPGYYRKRHFYLCLKWIFMLRV